MNDNQCSVSVGGIWVEVSTGAFLRVSRGNPSSKHAGLEAFIPQFANNRYFFPSPESNNPKVTRVYVGITKRYGESGLFCTGIPSYASPFGHATDPLFSTAGPSRVCRALFFSFFVFYPLLNLYLFFFTYSINIYTNFSVIENGSVTLRVQNCRSA